VEEKTEKSKESNLEHLKLPRNWERKITNIVKKYGKQGKRPNIVIATGGTGGHIFPAQAVAQILSNRYNIIWLTDSRGAEIMRKHCVNVGQEPGKLNNDVDANFAVQKEARAESTTQQAKPCVHTLLSGPMHGRFANKLKSLSKVLLGTVQGAYYMLRYRPILTLGFGGYASTPTLLASLVKFVPIVLHEQNAVMGQVNRIFAGLSKLIILSFPETQMVNAKHSNKHAVLGNPVRPEVWAEGQKRCNNKENPDEIKLLIIGGSQGADFFCDVVPEAIAKLPEMIRCKFVIQHQVSENRAEEVRAKYMNAKVKMVETQPFFMDIGSRMHNADLVIARSGASTVSDIACMRVPAIFIPLASSKDNHQYHNAQLLADSGMAIVVEEKDIDIKNIGMNGNKEEDSEEHQDLAKVLKSILVDGELQKMRKKAREKQTLHAASRIAVRVNQLLMGG
jgi:UDP-N-acetylglucosamine--N-acetylmuramyl-(pentapeptide) pyrophosphoryl-undecaprenol N-acetylglucosamine transferase